MGLPAAMHLTEPQADEIFSWGTSFTNPGERDFGFATIPLGNDSFDFASKETGENGLSMEGVEIGIAAPSDQDLVKGTDGLVDEPHDFVDDVPAEDWMA